MKHKRILSTLLIIIFTILFSILEIADLHFLTQSISTDSTYLDRASNSPLSELTPKITELVFTGVIVPARCVQAAIDERGNANYLYENVIDVLVNADITIGTLNATLSDYPPHTGCTNTLLLVGSSTNADAMKEAGFDVMSIATNHIKNCGVINCGDIAFYDTLDNLERVGIAAVGAGLNLAEGIAPIVLEINGTKFGFVSLGEIEERSFAGENTPGIGVLTEENWRTAIQATHLVADVVIAMPHFGPENSIDPNYLQQNWVNIAIEEGADLIVGNHTHVIQAYQEIEETMVFYGLGNFVFDQTWARDHQQGMILRAFFQGETMVEYELIATIVDGDGTVHFADAKESQSIFDRIDEANQRLSNN
jgi:poly-gamma-glutamate capsule biosynthesis protein CapA/YwtB (metallophosphatase superfamily)